MRRRAAAALTLSALVTVLTGCASAQPHAGPTTTVPATSDGEAATQPTAPARPTSSMTPNASDEPRSPATTSPAPASPDALEPVLTYAAATADGAHVELTGVVPGIIENGGRCVFTLSSGSTTVTRQQEGLADASSTSCGTVDVAVAELSSGAWTASLGYSGARASGHSASVQVIVP